MAAEILINVRPLETRIAYLENGVLLDLIVERKHAPTLVGSIYKGKVVRILPGMQAAFVDIGLEKAAFLYVGDVRDVSDDDGSILIKRGELDSEGPALAEQETESKDSEKSRLSIQDLLHEGQFLLVQVAKDPLGTKGARITTHVSLPGRHIVYLPTLKQIGISRRIEEESERERLKSIVESLKPHGGVIIRTAAEGASSDSLKLDLDYLDRVWKDVGRNYEKKKNPGLIHSEPDIELQALRDLLSEEVHRVVVDERRAYRKVLRFVSQFIPRFNNKIDFYEGDQPLFDQFDVEMEISRSIGRKIWLRSGGYIVIDEAEALTVVDVNTGRYVGKRDLEDTILKTNLEAARETAHQLRVRNCGGIIIIDFIDLEKEVHREMVLNALKEELQRDRARTNVLKMSNLGLVEMTRKRIRPSLVKTLCHTCSYCDGKGYIKRSSTVAYEIFREIEREGSVGTKSKELSVLCHAKVVDWIYEAESEMTEYLENRLKHPIQFRIEPNFHIEQFELIFS